MDVLLYYEKLQYTTIAKTIQYSKIGYRPTKFILNLYPTRCNAIFTNILHVFLE